MRALSRAAILCNVVLLALAGPAAARAQGFERPPSFDIHKVRGLWPSGDNYTIKNPVRSDGLLRVFTLQTPYGVFVVHGDQMLRMRAHELAALFELEKVSNSESYGKALVDAGLSPLKYTGRLLADPGKTVSDTFNGIGTMFGRISSDLGNIGKTPGDPISGLLGVTDQRRKLATKVGVDPYTDFPPLDAKLSRLAEAAAAGGLTVSAALIVAPIGTAGIVFSNLSTASTVEGVRIDELARDRTAAQIFDLNRQALHRMGVDDKLIEALLANRNYTPIDMAVIVASLEAMAGVAGKPILLARVAEIDSRPLAYFMRRSAEMLRNHQRRGAGFARIELLGGYPFMITRDGHVVAVMPIDALSWTKDTAAALRDSAAAASSLRLAKPVELRITGTATPLAKRELQKLGVRVAEHVKF
jgi:hypothetical protein